MADIRFQNPGDEFYRPAQARSGGLPAFIIRLGIARDVKTANYILLGIAIVAILVGIFFYARSGPAESRPDKIVPVAGPGDGVTY